MFSCSGHTIGHFERVVFTPLVSIRGFGCYAGPLTGVRRGDRVPQGPKEKGVNGGQFSSLAQFFHFSCKSSFGLGGEQLKHPNTILKSILFYARFAFPHKKDQQMKWGK